MVSCNEFLYLLQNCVNIKMSKAFLKGELDKEFRSLERHQTNQSKNKKSNVETQSTSRHGVKKAQRRLKSNHNNTKTTAFFRPKKMIERSHEESDKTNENIQKLLVLSETVQLNSSSKSNIINHTEKSKRHYEPKSRNFIKNLKGHKPTKESSLFTEEDFDKFSKEYFLNSNPINKSSLEKMKSKELEY